MSRKVILLRPRDGPKEVQTEDVGNAIVEMTCDTMLDRVKNMDESARIRFAQQLLGTFSAKTLSESISPGLNRLIEVGTDWGDFDHLKDDMKRVLQHYKEIQYADFTRRKDVIKPSGANSFVVIVECAQRLLPALNELFQRDEAFYFELDEETKATWMSLPPLREQTKKQREYVSPYFLDSDVSLTRCARLNSVLRDNFMANDRFAFQCVQVAVIIKRLIAFYRQTGNGKGLYEWARYIKELVYSVVGNLEMQLDSIYECGNTYWGMKEKLQDKQGPFPSGARLATYCLYLANFLGAQIVTVPVQYGEKEPNKFLYEGKVRSDDYFYVLSGGGKYDFLNKTGTWQGYSSVFWMLEWERVRFGAEAYGEAIIPEVLAMAAYIQKWKIGNINWDYLTHNVLDYWRSGEVVMYEPDEEIRHFSTVAGEAKISLDQFLKHAYVAESKGAGVTTLEPSFANEYEFARGESQKLEEKFEKPKRQRRSGKRRREEDEDSIDDLFNDVPR